MGDASSFEGILVDTRRYYEERGGVEKKRPKLGRELSIYRPGMGGEEEVSWMQAIIALSGKAITPIPAYLQPPLYVHLPSPSAHRFHSGPDR